jgi:Icc-related predicted phosphoesterase
MRIVFTSDTHFPFPVTSIPEGDVLVHAGDLMYSGYPDEWDSRLKSLAALPHKHKLLVPGNHDFHIQNYEGVAKAELRGSGVKVLGLGHNPFRNIDGVSFLGIPFVTGLEGWAYNRGEEWLLDYLQQIELLGTPDIVVSHAPMRGVLDAINPNLTRYRDQKHVGSRPLKTWFDNLYTKPKYWAHGHIHESYGKVDIDGCTVMNVAMCDRDYKLVNQPMVVDL